MTSVSTSVSHHWYDICSRKTLNYEVFVVILLVIQNASFQNSVVIATQTVFNRLFSSGSNSIKTFEYSSALSKNRPRNFFGFLKEYANVEDAKSRFWNKTIFQSALFVKQSIFLVFLDFSQ